MTDLYIAGPPVHRLRYLLEYCQAKRIAPTLLTRGLADQAALADPLATLPWPDFLHVVVNSLQILPKTEFNEAAAHYWQQPMNDHWIALGRSMSAPFDLLIDLIGDAGHLFQDMPVKVTTRHRAQGALTIEVDADSDLAPNTALSALLMAEINGFAQAVALTPFRIESQPMARGFVLRCSTKATPRSTLSRWLTRLNTQPLPSLRITLQRQRRVESSLRKKVTEGDGARRALQAALDQIQTNLARLLNTINADQFDIEADNQLHHRQGAASERIGAKHGITDFDQFTAHLTDASKADCETQLQKVRAGIQTQAFINLTTLAPKQGPKMKLLLQRANQTRVKAALIPVTANPQTLARTPPEALSEALQALSNEAACLTNLGGIIEWHNDAFLQLTGAREHNCLGARLAEFVPVTLSENQLRAFYQDPRGAGRLTRVPAWFLSISGAKTPVQISAVGIGYEVSAKKIYIFDDRSAVQEGQQSIDQAHHQLEALRTPAMIGEMTRGVAHDLGNLLTLIQLASEQIIKTAPRPLPAVVQHLETAVNDAGTLTKMLLRTDAPGQAADQQTELITLIQELTPAIEIVLGPEMTFTLDLDTHRSPLDVLLSGPKLKNVLLNLVINARDAMPTDGQLTLRILPDNRWTDPATATVKVGHLIEVTDNGAGIPNELQAHLFKSGFTTKGHRGGHGIGLSSIHSMITEHGGDLHLGPGPGGGTRVRLWLPKAEKIDFKARLSKISSSLPVKQRTALVVEPDAQIREFLTLTLTALNFKVFTAADGAAGLDLYLKKSVYLDLIISELVLPVLAGHAFLQRLYQTNPRQVVLILSAFIETQPHPAFLADKPWMTLTKPFSLAQLKTAIQQSLESSGRQSLTRAPARSRHLGED